LRGREEGKKVLGQQDIEDWVHRTEHFIEAAFDKAEARRFMSGQGYKREGVQPYHNLVASMDKNSIPVRLWRLNELTVRANELPIDPDLDPESWRGHFTSTRQTAQNGS
jgi:hypothetical protein